VALRQKSRLRLKQKKALQVLAVAEI